MRDQRPLGKTGILVGAIGLGGMPLSLEGRPTEEQAIAVIHRALDLGVTLIDTADAYCIDEKDKHHNERLIAKALALYGKDTSPIIVATKGGLLRPQGHWITQGDPKHIRKTIRESHQALGGEKPIPLWQLHAPDPKFPIEETMQPVREAVDEGLIRFVGLSNVTVNEITRARQIVAIASIQNQYNPWKRSAEQDGVLKFCEKEGLSFLPWSPLGGSGRVHQLQDIPVLQNLAREKNISPQRLVLSWMLAKSPRIIPIPGASQISSLEDSIGAVEINLSPQEMDLLNGM